ncbi:MFS transporter, partial [Nocardiopsis sp. MG754419]|uniref:MFS transporter n=1 Tax=Nocardiopsis sp. MG754419 TaxID=2259865 RepID=UPI001BA8C34E
PQHPPVTQVHDWRGRRYTVGPDPRELIGLPRSALLARALVAAAAVGVLQFGYGAALPTLVAAHDWTLTQAWLPFLVWALVQGSCAPLPRLFHARGLRGPGTAVGVGAALCSVAVFTLGHTADPMVAVLAYGVVGGVGAGLVHHACTDLVAGWFPDRHTVRLGAVGGAFALGAVPILPAIVLALTPETLPWATTLLALTVLALGLIGGVGQRRAPDRWWPPGSDPRTAALRRSADPPAARDFTAGQAWTSGHSLPALHVIVALSGATGLFTLATLPTILPSRGHDPTTVAVAVTVFALAGGLGRICASGAAEHTGRRRTLALLMLATALGALLLAAVAPAGPTVLVVGAALVVGAGTGACYPLTRAITEGHFGSDPAAALPGLVHGSKAVGGLLGVGGAIVFLPSAPADALPLVLAGAAAPPALAALLAARLRRPLPIRTLPKNGVWTAERRSAPM